LSCVHCTISKWRSWEDYFRTCDCLPRVSWILIARGPDLPRFGDVLMLLLGGEFLTGIGLAVDRQVLSREGEALVISLWMRISDSRNVGKANLGFLWFPLSALQRIGLELLLEVRLTHEWD